VSACWRARRSPRPRQRTCNASSPRWSALELAASPSRSARTALRADGSDATRFLVGVFLNLSPEHLDFHGSMTGYFEAKARVFEPERCQQAIVCVDDEWGRRLASTCRTPVTTFGRRDGGDVHVVEESRRGLGGLRVRLSSSSGEVVLDSPLIGRVDATNIAAAFLAARAAGVSKDQAVSAVSCCAAPPGRFEIVTSGEPFLVVVDHAHTPDALAAVLATARELATSATARSRQLRAWHHLRFAVAFARHGDRERAAQSLARLASERLLLASGPAILRLLAPFLASRAVRRVRLRSEACREVTRASAPWRSARACSRPPGSPAG
jgi:UDP-N-acetylmuramyl tripeptide synthase